jgi:hypothetical protein
MKSRIIAASSGLALIAGCSGQPQNSAGTGQNDMAAGNAATTQSAASAAPAGEAGFRQLAECAAMMEAVSRLYNAIASREQGARAEEMRRTASARGLAAFDFETSASSLGASLGKTQADIERIKRERHARLEQERARQPDFGEFAIWLGREADRCPPPRCG